MLYQFFEFWDIVKNPIGGFASVEKGKGVSQSESAFSDWRAASYRH